MNELQRANLERKREHADLMATLWAIWTLVLGVADGASTARGFGVLLGIAIGGHYVIDGMRIGRKLRRG